MDICLISLNVTVYQGALLGILHLRLSLCANNEFIASLKLITALERKYRAEPACRLQIGRLFAAIIH